MVYVHWLNQFLFHNENAEGMFLLIELMTMKISKGFRSVYHHNPVDSFVQVSSTMTTTLPFLVEKTQKTPKGFHFSPVVVSVKAEFNWSSDTI